MQKGLGCPEGFPFLRSVRLPVSRPGDFGDPGVETDFYAATRGEAEACKDGCWLTDSSTTGVGNTTHPADVGPNCETCLANPTACSQIRLMYCRLEAQGSMEGGYSRYQLLAILLNSLTAALFGLATTAYGILPVSFRHGPLQCLQVSNRECAKVNSGKSTRFNVDGQSS